MPDLLSLQNRFATALLADDLSGLSGYFRAGGASAAERLNIFRNNTIISLTECLKTVFPVTLKLCDARFFSYAAHEFITRFPPHEARLSTYGAAFPRFLAGFDACRAFPLIAEMAALEWAISDSLNDAAEMAIPLAFAATALGAGKEISITLQPGLRFIVSRWPLLGVWLDHQHEPVMIRSPLNPQVSRIVVMSHGDDIQYLELDAPRFAFWRALRRGRSLNEAAAKALTRDRLFDVVRETLLLFRIGAITGVFTTSQKETRP